MIEYRLCPSTTPKDGSCRAGRDHFEAGLRDIRPEGASIWTRPDRRSCPPAHSRQSAGWPTDTGGDPNPTPTRTETRTPAAFDYGRWFDDVSNFDGTEDGRGSETVEIAVESQWAGDFYTGRGVPGRTDEPPA